jgi:hypothetical protein
MSVTVAISPRLCDALEAMRCASEFERRERRANRLAIRKKVKILKWLIWLISKISPPRTEITALSHNNKNGD